MHELFKKYGLKHLSISQVKTMKRSPFAWLCEKVLGRRSPDTEATAFGSFVHDNFERWLKGRVSKPEGTYCSEEGKEFFVEAWVPKTLRFWEDYRKVVTTWPEPENVEVGFKVTLDPSLPPFLGVVDVFTEDDNMIMIQDHKTIGNKSFAPKTPEDLMVDPQLCIYAHALAVGTDKVIKVQHNQLFKKIKRKPVNILTAEVLPEEIAKAVEGVRVDALEAIKILEKYSIKGIKGFAEDIKEQYLTTRWDFGGCPHWDFFHECLKKDVDYNEDKNGEEEMPKNLHDMVGKAREHFTKEGFKKFDLADAVVDAVIEGLKAKEVKAVYVRDCEGGDLIYNQLLNRVAEQGIMIFKKVV